MIYFTRLLFFVFIFHQTQLISFPIDLSSDQFKQEIAIPPNEEFIELHHFQKNRIYILAAEKGEFEERSLPFLLANKNTLLIENKDELDGDNSIAFKISSNVTQLVIVTIPSNLYPNLGTKWDDFINKSKDSSRPSNGVTLLAAMSSHKRLKNVLTVGSETGKDPLFWVKQGTDVTILDGTPHGIAITAFRLAPYISHLKGAYAATLEAIPDDIGTFDAVTGSAVFPFIPPSDFVTTMKEKIFSHIAPEGYFAGIFFGKEHAWSSSPHMTFVTREELIELFESSGFQILHFVEEISEAETVFKGLQIWHSFDVVAQKKF